MRHLLIAAALVVFGAPQVGAQSVQHGVSEERGTVLWQPGEPTLLGEPVSRGGFHFQLSFGWGGGPDSTGLFHAMELGYTMDNGWTIAYLHTFIQNKGFASQLGGPDLFGGHLLELKVPVFGPEMVLKVAVGPGGTHDQSDGIKGHIGLGWAYGLDFHLPIFESSGITLGLTVLHATAQGRHHWGAALGVGYTVF